ncbi:putative membrane protein [Evansella vedderi]|uniref:Membrane protein n=1 Tax=Evansella vedderi TaxID=38282 RepID=A0ABT9ZYL1_9BACI|nr:TIGR03943 family protein [Evansella vedderi]MDQ0256341.1 putative membrane protein [Evansella vedderi]
MYFHTQEAIKAIILLLFSGFIFMLHHTGEIIKFINPQYTAFSQIASVIFLFLFFIQVPRIFISKEQAEDHDYCTILGCNHEVGSARKVPLKSVLIYSIVLFPLVTGFLLPYKDLGAAEAVKRGICYTPNEQHLHHSEELVTSNKVFHEMMESPVLILNNLNFSVYVNNILTYPEFFDGKPLVLEGFILVGDDHPFLARFLVTHCVADAHVTGLLLSSDDNNLRNANDWVKVYGLVDTIENNGQVLPIIQVKEWKQIDQPKIPYVYP